MTGERRIIAALPDGGVDTPIVSRTRSSFDNTGFQTPGTPNVPSALDLNAFADGGEIWVVADWTTPTLNGTGQITQWAIETLKDGDTLPGIEIANADQEPPHRIGNLEPNTLYHVSVRALTSSGASSTPLTGDVTTGHDLTAPPTLTGFNGGAGYTNVTLTWTALGTTLLPWKGKYFVDQALDSGFTSSLVTYDNGDSNVATIGKLTTGTTYYFRVHARSASGVDGPVSATLSFTPGLADAFFLPSDGVTPSTTTAAPTVTGGPGYLFVKWSSVVNDDAVMYEVHVSTSSGFTPSSSTKSTEVVGSNVTGANSAFLKKTGTGTDLAYATNYYVKIYPKDRDGYSTAGPSPQTGPTQLVQVNTPDIAVGAITAGSLIVASIDAGVITVGTLDASGIAVTNLSAAAITTGNIGATIGYLGTIVAGQITSGTIDASVIAVTNLSASNITTGTMSVGKLAAGTIGAVGIILASGGTIRSSNWVSHTSGWSIDGAGNAEVNNLVAYGSINTTSGTLNIQIGSVGVNEITFNTADAVARGFIQNGSGGSLAIQAPTTSGNHPGLISMLDNLMSLEVNGTNMVVRPTKTQVFKDLEINGCHLTGNYDSSTAPAIQMRSSNVFTTSWDGSALHFFTDVSNVKTFIIPHPVDSDRWLVHATLEGPENTVFYRGQGRLVDGWAQIGLPAYFEALTSVEGRSVQLTCVAENVKDEWCPVLHATYPTDGKFYVGLGSGSVVSDQRFWWEVKANRKDVPQLLVEPLRDEVTVHGEGPYTYYSQRDKTAA